MIWTSDERPLEATAQTLPELALNVARSDPDRPALTDLDGATITFGRLASRTERVAARLAERGFGAGDVLAVWAANSPAWATVALGAIRGGGAVTGVPGPATSDEARAQIESAGARWLVVDRSALDRARAAAAGIAEVIEIDDQRRDPWRGDGGPAPELDRADDGRLALLPFSSGTAGLPKGVMLTHANLVAAARQVGRALGLTEGDAVLTPAPFAHVMGFVVGLAAPLAAGARVLTLDRFDLARMLAAIERERISVLVVPPPVMTGLARDPGVERHDLSSVELIVSGGAPLPPDVHRAVAARFPGAAVGQGYGLTETAVGITGPHRRRGSAPGSVGRLMASTELRVVDPESGSDLGPGQRGELWARGPQVMRGYRGPPEATRAMVTADGWLRTGDLGSVDPDGDVHVHERLKELIKVDARQVAPAELEALLIDSPSGRRCRGDPASRRRARRGARRRCHAPPGARARPADRLGRRAGRPLQAHP